MRIHPCLNRSWKKLSEFVLSQSLATAESIISQHEQISLSKTDWALFLDALENPPAKNAKLKQALVLHKKSVVKA
ncbi:type II toxin-antitoxin system TacA family antitoxin [Methylomonas rivi]|uniref:DUF1778 domain-containing protein n=1 Tax=Methylomonas rivi TaxID=2952226 RepID=A0ABT1U490_9GAMM|nr:DUF1778 domain-containing protein [Methylomonas sp. WSC-6]MBS4050461.1 DUF1778 domain-containing protein [Methylomonas sp.]MCQ8128657.1 DUF1778 domain-containing protein [Methylomonas sp. WSC-6]